MNLIDSDKFSTKNIEHLQKFLHYLKNYFLYITKFNKKILIVSTKGILPIQFYCKKFRYDYILANSETLVNRLFTNYLEIKKSKKNIGYLTRHPSLVFLPHNIYNPTFYKFKKYGVVILCAVKIENTGNNLSFVEPTLFFIEIKTYKLENASEGAFRLKIEMFANFLFLMLFFYLVKLRLARCSSRQKLEYMRGTKKKKFKSTPTSLLSATILIQRASNYYTKKNRPNTIQKISKSYNDSSKTTNKMLKYKQHKFNNFKYTPKTDLPPEDYIIRNTTRIGPARTTKKKYNFRRYFKYVQPRQYLKTGLYDRKLMRFKKLIQLRFNLIDWAVDMLKIKSKIRFYKRFLITKAPYFALSSRLTGLYKIEIQLNFLLLRSFFAPNLEIANLLILNKYVIVNNKTNSKPTTKINLMAIVSLPKLLQLTLFLFKPYRFSRFFLHRRVLRYLRYKYYFRRHLLKKYYYFNFFNKRLQKLTKFRPVKQQKNKIGKFGKTIKRVKNFFRYN
jgi:hypothetical protein